MKGVVIAHENATAFLDAMQSTIRVSSDDVYLWTASISFITCTANG